MIMGGIVDPVSIVLYRSLKAAVMLSASDPYKIYKSEIKTFDYNLHVLKINKNQSRYYSYLSVYKYNICTTSRQIIKT